MISVGILDTRGLGQSPSLASHLPKSENLRIEKIKNEKKKRLSFFSRVLLSEMYEREFKKKLPEISYTEEGKPYFKSKECFFSISQSEDFVAVAISDFEVGVDIQSDYENEDTLKKLEKRFDLEVFDNAEEDKENEIQFSFFDIIEEKENVVLKENKTKCFGSKFGKNEGECFLFRWTRLESALKLIGGGFKDLINVNKNLQNIRFKTLFFQHGDTPIALSVASLKG